MEFIYSLLFGFVSFLIIVSTSCYLQYKKIKDIFNNASANDIEALKNSYSVKYDMEDEEDFEITKQWNEDIDKTKDVKVEKRSFFENFNIASIKNGFSLFFTPLRLLGYIVFIVVIVLMIKNDLLDFIGLFVGVFLSNVVFIVYLTLRK